ncbi:hypothetical protein Pure05_29730 [Paenarthrobacter ureafaciens]|nr:hypothetical protein Pure01_30540 [Paenarthrobacter ureafaciens]GLU64730.1 hypothetical protein Pure02_29800 [Paenarthrobacter ureafaciens]GLU69010.1 hypothetical protein Pure03_29860 [Paenarthrobacter ureafaciens]GLU73348.1 hypothetical protein Pure04_30630 [Paenarthrobacter ureafaciens]GLU77533.1 hypothetical protein Pure05_29730 [Paenarthrobacter ureafaciens]
MAGSAAVLAGLWGRRGCTFGGVCTRTRWTHLYPGAHQYPGAHPYPPGAAKLRGAIGAKWCGACHERVRGRKGVHCFPLTVAPSPVNSLLSQYKAQSTDKFKGES